MLATGNLENLGDAKLRERLVNYYTSVDTVQVTLLNVRAYRDDLNRQIGDLDAKIFLCESAKKIIRKVRQQVAAANQ